MVETLGTYFTPLEMSLAHHDQLMRWDYESGLATCPRHVKGLFWYRIRAVAIDPEEAAINGTIVRFPSWRQRADKLDVPLWQNSLPVPHSVLKIQIAKPRPVSCGCQFVSLRQKISKGIGFQHHGSDADLVKEHALRKR